MLPQPFTFHFLYSNHKEKMENNLGTRGDTMAQAIVARENGDAYQRMVLWHHITKLLFRDSDYLKLYTEHSEVKSFDDKIGRASCRERV